MQSYLGGSGTLWGNMQLTLPGGGGVALYGGLLGAAEVKVLQHQASHGCETIEVGVDEKQPLIPVWCVWEAWREEIEFKCKIMES